MWSVNLDSRKATFRSGYSNLNERISQIVVLNYWLVFPKNDLTMNFPSGIFDLAKWKALTLYQSKGFSYLMECQSRLF